MKKFHSFIHKLAPFHNAVIYKEVTQGLRSRFFFYGYILLTLCCLGIDLTVLLTNEEHYLFIEIAQKKPFYASCVCYYLFNILLMIWSVWLAIQESNAGNNEYIAISGKRPGMMIFGKTVSLLLMAFLSAIPVFALNLIFESARTYTLSSKPFLLFLIPLTICPFYFLALSGTSLKNRFLRYILPLTASVIAPAIFFQIANYMYLRMEGIKLSFYLYLAAIYFLSGLYLFYYACNSISSHLDSYQTVLKQISLTIFSLILFILAYKLNIHPKIIKTWTPFIKYSFLIALLATYSTNRSVPAFRKIRSQRNILTKTTFKYLGPGKQNNAAVFLIAFLILFLAGATPLIDAACIPHSIHVLLYPFYITIVLHFIPDNQVIQPFIKFVKAGLLVLIITFEQFIYPRPFIQEIPLEFKNILFYSCSLTGLLLLLKEHLSPSNRKVKRAGKIKAFLLQRVKPR